MVFLSLSSCRYSWFRVWGEAVQFWSLQSCCWGAWGGCVDGCSSCCDKRSSGVGPRMELRRGRWALSLLGNGWRAVCLTPDKKITFICYPITLISGKLRQNKRSELKFSPWLHFEFLLDTRQDLFVFLLLVLLNLSDFLVETGPLHQTTEFVADCLGAVPRGRTDFF